MTTFLSQHAVERVLRLDNQSLSGNLETNLKFPSDPSPSGVPSPSDPTDAPLPSDAFEADDASDASDASSTVLASLPRDGLYDCVIKESEGKGLGLFAICDILPGKIVLVEPPLLVVDHSESGDPLEDVLKELPPEKRKAYQSLCAHHHPDRINDTHNQSIFYTNGFEIGPTEERTGVFSKASRVNHSCMPNTKYSFKEGEYEQTRDKDGRPILLVHKEGRMIFKCQEKLLAGEEITIDYGHGPNRLKYAYGFDCDCGGYTDVGSIGEFTSNSWVRYQDHLMEQAREETVKIISMYQDHKEKTKMTISRYQDQLREQARETEMKISRYGEGGMSLEDLKEWASEQAASCHVIGYPIKSQALVNTPASEDGEDHQRDAPDLEEGKDL